MQAPLVRAVAQVPFFTGKNYLRSGAVGRMIPRIMAIYKRGGVWWYDFQFLGERYQASTRTGNKQKAESIKAKVRADLALGVHGLIPQKAAPLLRDYAETFRKYVENHNAGHPHTVKFYSANLRRLLEYPPFADARLGAITEALIAKYVAHRTEKMARASINNELTTLRHLLHVAQKTHELIRKTPSVTLLPGVKGRDFVLSFEQEGAYLAAADPRLRSFALLALDTGVRVGEGVALEWSDVHLAAAHNATLGYIQIREGKGPNAKRVLSLSPRVIAMLEELRDFNPADRWVFQSRKRKVAGPIKPSWLDCLHSETRATAIMPDGKLLSPEFVVHSLRHTFATRLGEAGAPAHEIMKILGHHSITVSEKYVHPTPESLERAFGRLHSMNAIMRGDASAIEALGVPTEITKKEKPISL